MKLWRQTFMTIPEILEVIMLICFGLSWPIAAIRSFKSHNPKSTNVPFILLILFGYMAGVTAKFISGNVGYVLIAYLINILSVIANLVVFFVNKRRVHRK